MKLDQRGKVLAEYIWIDGSNGLRNKTKVCKVQISLLPLVVWSVEHVSCPLNITNDPNDLASKHEWQRLSVAALVH